MEVDRPVQLEGRKTEREFWDANWQGQIRMRLPTGLSSSMRNVMRLLRAEVRPGDRLLEIGCAPGKLLAWDAAILGARVSGLDYSGRGMESARQLFRALELPADLRCEDVFATSFEPGSFDVVCSFGLIEHFDDPTEIVRRHVLLSRPGGVTLIGIPNFGGIYGRLERWLDPEILAIHNLAIMSPAALARLAPPDLAHSVWSRACGRLAPGPLSFERRLPSFLATPLNLALNLVGLCQPFDIPWISPLLALRIVRK